MVRYFNKIGKEIHRQTWEKLLRNPRYVNLAQTGRLLQEVNVRTSWLGLRYEWEVKPGLFVTVVSREDGKERKDLKIVWASTEIEAMERHQECLEFVEETGVEPKEQA